MLDVVRNMKSDILFIAGVVVLGGSLVHLSVCQNQTERPSVTSSSDCTHRHEQPGKLAAVNLAIERIVISPSWGKAADSNIGTTSTEVLEETAIVNGRLATVITDDTREKTCILREDLDNTQASAR